MGFFRAYIEGRRKGKELRVLRESGGLVDSSFEEARGVALGVYSTRLATNGKPTLPTAIARIERSRSEIVGYSLGLHLT